MRASLFHILLPLISIGTSLFALENIEVPDGFIVDTVCDGIDGAVTMDVAADGRVFVCEQTGAVRVVKNGEMLEAPFLRLNVDDLMERGVIGVALHPKFPDEPFVYVHYVRKTPFSHHVISRFTAEGDVAKAGSELVMIEAEDQSLKVGKLIGVHQGGAMRFGADGKLYATIGEHNTREPAQSFESLHGKLLRFNPDGSIPEDNPFFKKLEGKFRAIYALGLRNPFGLAVDRVSGRMLVNDVGQELFEEIDEVAPGANYGWPVAEGLVGNKPEFAKPLHTYNRAAGVCISGGVFYQPFKSSGPHFPGAYLGKYFFADFNGGWIRVLDPAKPETSEPFAKRIPGPVDLACEPGGGLLVLARNAAVRDDKMKRESGTLFRIKATR
jgi:glucose/arabinose dehydrogenase